MRRNLYALVSFGTSSPKAFTSWAIICPIAEVMSAILYTSKAQNSGKYPFLVVFNRPKNILGYSPSPFFFRKHP